MNDSREKEFEDRLWELAADFEYPPTPDIASAVHLRLVAGSDKTLPEQIKPQPAWSGRRTRLLIGVAAALLIVLGIAMTVPQVRAAVLEFLQIGAIRLDLNEGQPPAEATEAVSAAQQLPAMPATATPALDVQLPNEVVEQSSLAKTAGLVDFPMRLPTYPADLGQPDQIYIQQVSDPGIAGQVLIFDWAWPDRPGESRLSLYQIGVPYYGVKGASIESLQETMVSGRIAYWVPANHRLLVQSPNGPKPIMVSRDVLIWSDEVVTYRLESDLSLEEAVRVAESLELYAEE